MYYKVIKSGLDGISGGESRYESIDEVCREVFFSRGWGGLDQLHGAIRKWASSARPGSVFSTQVTAIIAAGESPIADDDCCPECGHEDLVYGEISPVEDGNIEQEIRCPGCGRHWKDVFVLVDRRKLS